MKCFDWETKVNYVDENNRVLGFDIQQQCCECADHGVFSKRDSEPLENVDLKPYRFVDEDPTDYLDGVGLSFRIEADGKPDLYVCIWNHHNGYYSHGFSHWRGEGCL